MSIINKGTAFSNGEQLTADKLNDLVDLATFDQSATDSASTTVNSSGQIVVADGGITSAKLSADAVETAKILDANVTFAKLADVIDDDTMDTASATKLATSESIKAYVDNSNPSPARVYNDLTHSTDSGTTQKNETGRPLWVSFTLLKNQGGIDYLLGEISPNDDMSAPNTRIGQSRVISRTGYSSAAQVTMIVPAGFSWKFSFSPSNTTERVHSSFIL